ncbi:MAG TPA: helix-turn-helix transcriptional regulator [Dongiaceae bacterium]|nr:helix-turn-helix transcriptional regulator [Dongiaceae bacterium]
MSSHASRPPSSSDALFNDSLFRERFQKFLIACIGTVTCYADFNAIVRHHVRLLLPHKMTLIGIGRISFGNVFIDQLVPIDFPETLIRQINSRSSLLERPVIEQWLKTGRPVLIPRGAECELLSDLERWEHHNFDLAPMAVHGQLDMSGRMASYFCFCQVEDLSERSELILELIIPHLQVALMKAHLAETAITTSSVLTRKEYEILQWVVLGKTNREIATILSKSELTVRNQVHCILRKLQASTRSEAVQKADEMGLLVQWQNIKMNRALMAKGRVVGSN